VAIVAITRQAGSDGDPLGEQLADRLQYRLVRRTDLLRLAADVGGPGAWERSPELRERTPSFWERLNEDRQRHASVLRSVVVQLAEQDDVVIVGLGAGQLLSRLGQVLRLLVIAPPDVRLARVMQAGFEDTPGPLNQEQARDLIRRRDRETVGYMRYLFRIDWLEPHHWDMVINTGRFTLPQTVEVIVAMIDGGQLEPNAADRQRLANLGLACRVESALMRQPSVWVNGLKVWADRGHVRLEGEVLAEDDRDPILAVEDIVREIEGVQSIDSALRIQPPPRLSM
jgi:cytidylate kinase